MAKSPSRFLYIVIGSALVVALAGAVYGLTIVMSEQVTFRRGDLAYRLIVTDDAVRQFPTFAAEGRDVEYVYNASRDDSPRRIGLRYVSDVYPDDLARAHLDHCTRRNFKPLPVEQLSADQLLGCDAPDLRMEAGFHPRDDGMITVVVTFTSR